jgi:hypothetical protein
MSAKKKSEGKGCNCKKTQCQKKYCECFSSGIACGLDCKCEDCANGEGNNIQLSLESFSKKSIDKV